MEGITPEQLEAVQQQCIFCQIASGKVASKKVYEDDQVIAVLDINPANPGHLLVITKKHYFVMPQMPDDETEHVGKIAKQLSQVLLKALKVEGTTIFIANGVAAGQKAQHFMLHVIPRKEGDGVGLEIPQKQISPEDYDRIYKALVQGVKKTLGDGVPDVEGIEDAEVVKEEESKEEETKKEPKEEDEEKEKTEETKEEEKKEETEDKEKEEEKKEKKEKTKKSKKKENKKPGLDDIAKVLG